MNQNTRDKRVADVIAIIGRDKAQINIIESALRMIEDKIKWEPLTKRHKNIANSLVRSLVRVEHTLARKDVSSLLDRMLIDYEGWLEDLIRFRGYVVEIATMPLDPPKPSALRFEHKRAAVTAAAQLLEHHGLRLAATQKAPQRQASTFCQVAAALYGNKRADLYHQCRSFMKTRNQSSK